MQVTIISNSYAKININKEIDTLMMDYSANYLEVISATYAQGIDPRKEYDTKASLIIYIRDTESMAEDDNIIDLEEFRQRTGCGISNISKKVLGPNLFMVSIEYTLRTLSSMVNHI